MAVNATRSKPESEYSRIAKRYAIAQAQKVHEIELEETNRQKELRFKATHTLLTLFLLWILYVHLRPF